MLNGSSLSSVPLVGRSGKHCPLLLTGLNKDAELTSVLSALERLKTKGD